MFFSKKSPVPSLTLREEAWQHFATRLELSDETFSESVLRDFLALDGRVLFGPIKGLLLSSGEHLVYFDYYESRNGPLGSVKHITSVCMLSVPKALANISVKASRKLSPILESLGASAIGGTVLSLNDDAAFTQAITLIANKPELVTTLLTPIVKRLLHKALYERRAEPTFLLGEHHLLFLNKKLEHDPTPLETLELFSSDLLSLYSALGAAIKAATQRLHKTSTAV